MKSKRSLRPTDPCPCGSKAQYRDCCQTRDELERLERPGAFDDEFGDHFADEDEFEDDILERAVVDDRENPFPGLKFLKTVDQKQLSRITSKVIWEPAKQLFKEAAFASVLAARDASGCLTIEMAWQEEEGEPILTHARELSPDRDMVTSCSCRMGRYPGLCPHQVCLILALWTALKPERMESIHPLTRSRLEPLVQGISEAQIQSLAPQPGAVRLESLLFAVPRQGLDTPGFEHFDSDSRQQFELKRPLSRDLSRGVRLASLPSGMGYPSIFTQTERLGVWGYAALGETQLEKELRSGLYYCFSDGLVLNVSEVLIHPHARAVPPDLLPWTDTGYMHSLSADLPPWMRPGRNYVAPHLASADRAIVRVLFSALEFPESIRPGLFWVDPTELERQGGRAPVSRVPLRRLEGESPLAEGEVLFEGRLFFPASGDPRFTLKGASKQWRVGEEFAIGRDGKIFFHDLGPWMSTLSRYEMSDAWSLGSAFASESLERLLTAFGRNPYARLHIDPPIRELKAGQWNPRIDIRTDSAGRSDGFGVSIAPEVGMPMEALAPICRVLQSGLGGVSPAENKDIASRRGDKRDSDLRVLRHVGLGTLMVRETLFALLQGESPEPILERLDGMLGSAAALTDSKDWRPKAERERQLSRICSKAVQNLVREFVSFCATRLREDSVLMVVPGQGAFRVEGWVRKSFQLILAYLDGLALETGGACFTKARARAADQWDSDGARFGEPRSADFARRLFLPLIEQGFEVLSDSVPLEQMSDSDFLPQVGLTEGKDLDWFELNPKYFFKGKEISDADAALLMRQGWIRHQGRVFVVQARQLPSLRRLEAFWQRIQGGGRIGGDSGLSSRSLIHRLPKSRTLELLALRASGLEVQGGPAWDEICRFYDELDHPVKATERSAKPLKGEVHAQLKPYQDIGVRWLLDLYRLGLGGILADDMGLGKTLQALAFFEHLRAEGRLGHSLVVVPTSLTYNWESEAARFCPALPVRVFGSRDKEGARRFLEENRHGVLICTYGLLAEHSEFFAEQNWNIQLFDEAQSLKNIAAKRTSASRSIVARFKLCLTGTPLENHLGEFYSLMDLVVPGCLGDLKEFRKRYVSPDDTGEGVLKEDIQFLRMQAKPLVLRRTKAQILSELPEKIETTLPIEFEEKQKKIYRDIAVSWNEKVRESVLQEGEARSQLQMLTALLRLRQVCSDPGSIPQVKYTGIPPKLSLLRDSLVEIVDTGASALVFTQFLHTLERARGLLQEAGITHFVMHGGCSAAERRKVLSQFQEASGGAVLLMTLKTGGVGLNLTRASYVFHLEPWWNPAVENQATDRAHRIGQSRSVQVFRYIMHESVEEKINVLKARKAARFSAMFSEGEEEGAINAGEVGGNHLSQKDFEYLLGVEKPVRR